MTKTIDQLVEAKIKEFTSLLTEKEKVRIPYKKGDLGLHLDSPIKDYQDVIKAKKKTWEETSQALNALYVYNKNKHKDVAQKAKELREKLAAWVEKERKSNPNFGK